MSQLLRVVAKYAEIKNICRSFFLLYRVFNVISFIDLHHTFVWPKGFWETNDMVSTKWICWVTMSEDVLYSPSNSVRFSLAVSLGLSVFFFTQGDEVVLQSTFTSQAEHVKLCLAAEGFGSRLCRLEATSNCQVNLYRSHLLITRPINLPSCL